MHKKNYHRNLSYYARILMVISVTLLVYGIILDVQNSHRLLDPVKNVTSTTEEESTISITTSDGSEVVPGNTVVTVKGDDSPEIAETPSTIEETPSKQPNTNDRQEELVRAPTMEDINNSLRLEIEATFGVSVRYGSETEGYSVAGVETIPITDLATINNQLNRLKNALSLYPNGIFREIKNGGIPLTVILVSNYSKKNVTGVTDSSYTYANISIAAEYPFEESFYHESYHYIERYLFKKGASFNTWNALNPENFEYGSIYNDYSYNMTFMETAPFVNNYAQTADTEDRASTFEYMMANTKASCLNNGNVVWQKAVYMSRTMEAVLSTVRPEVIEYWERFL